MERIRKVSGDIQMLVRFTFLVNGGDVSWSSKCKNRLSFSLSQPNVVVMYTAKTKKKHSAFNASSGIQKFRPLTNPVTLYFDSQHLGWDL